MPSNVENILNGILTGDGSGIQKPASRVEELLFEIYEQGGGGGGDSVIGGIKLTIDENYVMTATLVDKDGEEYGASDNIDLPLETMVVDGEYDSVNKKIKLELKNGNYVEFSVAELVSGLQTELSSNNKLNPTYIAYDSSHRAVSDTEKNTWNAKQNAISDLETIRSGAAAGATAVQPSTMENALAAKQNSLSETQLAAVNSGITATKVLKIDSNISLVANRTVKNLLNIMNTPSGTSKGITFINNGDQSYTITGTSTDGDAYIDLMTLEAPFPEWLTAGTELGLRCSNSTARLIVIPRINGQYQSGVAAGVTDIASWVVPQNLDRLLIRFKVSDVGTSVNDNNVRGMICYKSLGEIDNSLVPGAISNYDLTRMISELQKKAVKVYTYHVNPNESDPEDAVTYLDDATGLTPAKMGSSSFSYGSWANAWFLPRPCVLKFDGTVDYYLNPNDYSKKTDGTASTIDSSNSTGNVMLEFPKIWVKRVNDGNGARTVSIAPVNVDGTYKCWSNINAEDKEVDHFYLPAYNGTIHSSKMRSLSGVTLNTTYAPNYTRAQEVTAATANNPTGKNMWYTETWADFCLIYDLLYLMGKSLDVQRTFGQGLSSGSGTAMRAYITGTHNAKGLFYGDISGTSTAVKVLGMENLWGCRWHGVAGLINDNGTLKVKMTYGVADGSTTVGYNTTGSGYLDYGSTYGTGGFVKKMQADNTMGYKIIETAGTDATYYCDYYYVNNSQSNYALLGGSSDIGAYCGFCVDLADGAASAYWSFGGSLSCRL